MQHSNYGRICIIEHIIPYYSICFELFDMLNREKEKLLTTQRECVAQQKRGDDALAALEESRLQAQLLGETNSRSELAIKEKEQVCSPYYSVVYSFSLR